MGIGRVVQADGFHSGPDGVILDSFEEAAGQPVKQRTVFAIIETDRCRQRERPPFQRVDIDAHGRAVAIADHRAVSETGQAIQRFLKVFGTAI